MRTGQMKQPLMWEPNGSGYIALYQTRKKITMIRRVDKSMLTGASHMQRFGHIYPEQGVWHAMGTTFDQCRDFATYEEARLFIEALYAID